MGEVSPLNELYQRYQDQGFEFFTIYVREPHPGEHYGPHRTWAQKLKFARDCRKQDGIQNPMLVDDLEGTDVWTVVTGLASGLESAVEALSLATLVGRLWNQGLLKFPSSTQ